MGVCQLPSGGIAPYILFYLCFFFVFFVFFQGQNNQQKKQHSGEQRPDILAKNCKDYYCPECDKVFKFSAVDILRHKKSHKHNN